MKDSARSPGCFSATRGFFHVHDDVRSTSGWPFLKRQHQNSQALGGSRPRAAFFPRPSALFQQRTRRFSAARQQPPRIAQAQRKIQKARSARVGAGWSRPPRTMWEALQPQLGRAGPAGGQHMGRRQMVPMSPNGRGSSTSHCRLGGRSWSPAAFPKRPKSGMILRANGPKTDSTCVRTWGPPLASRSERRPPPAWPMEEKISHVPKVSPFPAGPASTPVSAREIATGGSAHSEDPGGGPRPPRPPSQTRRGEEGGSKERGREGREGTWSWTFGEETSTSQ